MQLLFAWKLSVLNETHDNTVFLFVFVYLLIIKTEIPSMYSMLHEDEKQGKGQVQFDIHDLYVEDLQHTICKIVSTFHNWAESK